MSRSRFYGHGHPRRRDPLDDMRLRISVLNVKRDLIEGENEWEDHRTPRGRLDYASERASIRALIDAKTKHHRGRRRSARERATFQRRRQLRRNLAIAMRNAGLGVGRDWATYVLTGSWKL